MPPSERGALAESISGPIDRLRRWDRVADTLSIETTWFVLANERRITAQRAGERRDRPHVVALKEALDLLRDAWGTTEVPWGKLSRHQRPLPGAPLQLDTTRTSLAVGATTGALGSVFVFESGPFGSPAPRLGRGGNSFVKVIAFGPQLRAASILNYGQSGDPASPHFFDQAELYARRTFKPSWFSRAAVEANAVRSYVVKGTPR